MFEFYVLSLRRPRVRSSRFWCFRVPSSPVLREVLGTRKEVGGALRPRVSWGDVRVSGTTAVKISGYYSFYFFFQHRQVPFRARGPESVLLTDRTRRRRRR